MEDAELEPSELGTQAYWRRAYSKEIINFDDHGDPGDVWFGEDSAFRVIKWICQCGIAQDAAVIDLGCGNGYTLAELAREGFNNLLGVDYCDEAIILAEKVAHKVFPMIRFQVFDVIRDEVSSLGRKFALVHDKGTYDAISLNPDSAGEDRRKYVEQVASMLDDNGLFVITSCNWTEGELLQQFSVRMKLRCVIPTPQYTFGGKVGGMLSSVVFVNK